MRGKLIIPTLFALAVACYYARLICNGRILNAFTPGRMVYRSEKPALFWVSVLYWALMFASMFFLFYLLWKRS